MIARVLDGQSLVDVALMTTGAVEGVWALALRNGLSVTAALPYGSDILYEDVDVIDARTVSRYRTDAVRPATEVSDATLATLMGTPDAVRDATYNIITADKPVPQSARAALSGPEFSATFV